MDKTTVVLPLMMVLLGYTGLEIKKDYPDNSHIDKKTECEVKLSLDIKGK